MPSTRSPTLAWPIESNLSRETLVPEKKRWSFDRVDTAEQYFYRLEPKKNDKRHFRIALKKTTLPSRAAVSRNIVSSGEALLFPTENVSGNLFPSQGQPFPSIGHDSHRTSKASDEDWSELELDPSVVPVLSSDHHSLKSKGSGSSKNLGTEESAKDLHDIAARVKRTTKGFVVRLFKKSEPQGEGVQDVYFQIVHPSIPELPSYHEAVEMPFEDRREDVHVVERYELPSTLSAAAYLPASNLQFTTEQPAAAFDAVSSNNLQEQILPLSTHVQMQDDSMVYRNSTMGSEEATALKSTSSSGELIGRTGELPTSRDELPAQYSDGTESTISDLSGTSQEKMQLSAVSNSVHLNSLASVPPLPSPEASSPLSSSDRTYVEPPTPAPSLAKPVDWAALLSEPALRRTLTDPRKRNLFRRNRGLIKGKSIWSSKKSSTYNASGGVPSSIQGSSLPSPTEVFRQEIQTLPDHSRPKHSEWERPSPSTPLRTTLQLLKLAAEAAILSAAQVSQWLHAQVKEPDVLPGHTRVRWTCTCGDRLFDDFKECSPGAARQLEIRLNNKGTISRGLAVTRAPTSASSSSGSSQVSSIFSSNSIRSHVSSLSSISTRDAVGQVKNEPSSGMATQGSSHSVSLGADADVLWLLACVPEGKFTPKLAHVSMDPSCVQSDRDVAIRLKERYTSVNSPWFKMIRLRGLRSIEFVQFEAHRNRFTDIRARPDMPPKDIDASYDFDHSQLIPPVGGHYLLHLFQHPEDYENETIFYERSPKKRGKLDIGVGWGVELVEGFMPARVWAAVVGFFLFGSTLFAVIWIIKKHDVQGAFAITSWICMFATLLLGWVQACVE